MPSWLHAFLTVLFALGCIAAPVGMIAMLTRQEVNRSAARSSKGNSNSTSIAIICEATLLSACSLWFGFGAPWVSGVIAAVSLIGLQGTYPDYDIHIGFLALVLAAIWAITHFIPPG